MTSEHPSCGNLGDEDHDDDGTTQMLITWSVLVQMDSMRAQMKGIGNIYALYEFVSTISFTAKLHFPSKSGSNMSSFEGAT